MISQETINAVLDRADIVSVITEYVPELTKKGTDYVCCCPFHQEKTPSFHVSAARQTWHCFGGCQEGGNVIKFLMKKDAITFPQAVKQLAQRYGIDFYEEQEPEEARKQRLRKEALWGLNERVAQYYASLLHEPANADALQYAVRRFGEDYVKEVGMGFAPDSWSTLVKWARERSESFDLLLELNLIGQDKEQGRYFDFYHNRLVIPIRDRQRHVIGFTARDLSGEEKSCKYLNSKESLIYHKKQSLFGLDEAIREAARKEQFFIVEGAPDALKMHSVGIYNVVAPLGGALTVEQLRLLRPITRHVCFINDADPPKPGERFGVGIDYVMKNGRLALMNGFSVEVREIPIGAGNTKQDPGSFFTSAAQLDLLPEEEFVGWYARKIWNEKENNARKAETIKHIAELASFIEDDTRVDILLDELIKLRKGRDFWRSLVNRAKWKRMEDEGKKTRQVDLQTYGFFEERGCYYGLSDKGETYWCNFTLQPLYHILDNERPRRIFEIRNVKNSVKTIELTPEELTSIARFRQKLESVGNFVWKAGEQDLINLKMYLYDNTETAYLVRQMGWNAYGNFYAFGNGIWADGAFHKADTHGIVALEKDESRSEEETLEEGDNPKYVFWYIPAAALTSKRDETTYERQRKFVHLPLQNIKFGEYMEKFVEVHGDNGKVGLSFWLASLFRDIITSHTRSFPLLNLFGPKGSGKTELGTALMAFFIVDNKAPNLKNATPVALNDDVAYACDALVHFDEYKNGLKPSMIEFLKGTYDGVGRVKMGGSNYEDRKMTAVKTGVIVSGQEMPTVDIALFHRCIFLSFLRSEFTTEERQRFAALQDIQHKGLTDLTLQVLEQRKRVQASFPAMYAEVNKEITARLNGQVLETRIVENWAKLLAVFRCVAPRLQFPFDYENLFDVCFNLMVRQNNMSGQGNELAHFWRTMMFLRDNGDLNEKGDYRIKQYYRFSSDIIQHREFVEPKTVLLINSSRVFNLYKETARRSGDKVIPDDALREYLKNMDYYLGHVRGVRFQTFKNGFPEQRDDGTGKMRTVSYIAHALAFDYEILKERYSITLEASTSLQGDEDDEGQKPQKRALPKQPELPF